MNKMFVEVASLLCTFTPRSDIELTHANKKSRDPRPYSKERREGQITTSEEETQLQGFS